MKKHAKKGKKIEEKTYLGISRFLRWSIHLFIPDQYCDSPSQKHHIHLFHSSNDFKPLRILLVAWLIATVVFGSTMTYQFVKLSSVLAAVNAFLFDVPGNYSFDTNKIEVSSGLGSLLSLDQTDDDNTTSGFAGGTFSDTQFDVGNNWLELDATGQSNGTGSFTSRIMDAGGIAAWTDLNWTPNSPYLKELPNSTNSESAYTSRNANMTGNVLLLHMNEGNWSGTPNEVIDSSGNTNHGIRNGNATTTTAGRFNNSGTFDGTGDYVIVNDDPSIEFTTSMTASGWFFFDTDINSVRLIEKGAGGTSNFEYRIVTLDGGVFGFNDGLLFQLSSDGSALFGQATCNGCLSTHKDKWVHIAGTYDGATIRLYINGVNISSTPVVGTIFNGTGNLGIGSDAQGLFNFDGKIDEVSLFSRPLSSTEILDHYRRGAIRLQYQVRSCDDALCDIETFIGPDGTGSTFYSELTNPLIGLPSVTLTNVPNNRYLQYQATLETDDATLSPEISSNTIGPAHFDAGNPTISNSNGITFTDITGFSEVLGGGHTGTIQYQISNNGSNWYYHNGANWVAASGFAQSNTAADINSNISVFDNEIGEGNFFFRAFFNSTLGTQAVELDSVSITFEDLTGQGGVAKVLENTPPAVPDDGFAVFVNNNADTTISEQVKLTFNVSDSISLVELGYNENLNDGTILSFQNEIDWQLCEEGPCGTGPYEVFARFYNQLGQQPSEIVSDSIELITIEPIIPDSQVGEEQVPPPPISEQPIDQQDTGQLLPPELPINQPEPPKDLEPLIQPEPIITPDIVPPSEQPSETNEAIPLDSPQSISTSDDLEISEKIPPDAIMGVVLVDQIETDQLIVNLEQNEANSYFGAHLQFLSGSLSGQTRTIDKFVDGKLTFLTPFMGLAKVNDEFQITWPKKASLPSSSLSNPPQISLSDPILIPESSTSNDYISLLLLMIQGSFLLVLTGFGIAGIIVHALWKNTILPPSKAPVKKKRPKKKTRKK